MMIKRYLASVILFSCFMGIQDTAFSGSDNTMAAGERIYTRCSGCHTFAYHRTGPKHCGLLGRRAGSATGFEYSKAMKGSGIIWTKKSLDQFLKAPLEFMSGTSMGYSGMDSDIERTQLIAFLTTLTENNPLCR